MIISLNQRKYVSLPGITLADVLRGPVPLLFDAVFVVISVNARVAYKYNFGAKGYPVVGLNLSKRKRRKIMAAIVVRWPPLSPDRSAGP